MADEWLEQQREIEELGLLDPPGSDPGLVRIVVDNRVRLTAPFAAMRLVREELMAAFTYDNPARAEAVRMKLRSKLPPEKVSTWAWSGTELSVPRGGMRRVRDILKRAGLRYEVEDRRSMGDDDIPLPPGSLVPTITARGYQDDIVARMMARENCYIRAGTGGGKTLCGFLLTARVRRPTLVVVWTGSLLRQWLRRCQTELGMRLEDVGIVAEGARKIGPVTIAMQQSLAADPEWVAEHSRTFGVLVADECFLYAPILMADGSLKDISEVLVGEEVALGGRVKAKMNRAYCGPGFSFGGAVSTECHPIATGRGWRKASKVLSSDLMWYDPAHEERSSLFGVRRPAQLQLEASSMQGAQAQCWIRCDGEVPELWEAHRSKEKGISCFATVRDEAGVERGTDCGDIRIDRCLREEGQGDQASEYLCLGSSCDGKAGRKEASFGGVFQSPNQEVRAGVGEGGESGKGSLYGSKREARCLWGEDAGQRKGPNSIGGEAVCLTRGEGVHPSIHSNDSSEGGGVAFQLQDRSGASCFKGGDRGGREQPFEEEERSRSEEDLLPRVDGLEGASLPDSLSKGVRLRRGRARVNSIGRIEGRVYNLETENGVYVAGGALVHNCQRFAARTFVASIDPFAARYRIGISADETRPDGMEFMIYDLFGDCAADYPHKVLVELGAVLEVPILVVPTEVPRPGFMYGGDPRRFTRLANHLAAHPERNALIEKIALSEVRRGNQVLTWCSRVEQCRGLDRAFAMGGAPSGVLVGGKENSEAFEGVIDGLNAGSLRVAVGTIQAVGQAIDLPSLSRGIITVPLAGKNRQQVQQCAGRICRLGSMDAACYYLWDRRVYGDRHLVNLASWFGQRVKMLVGELGGPTERWVSVAEYRARHKGRVDRSEDDELLRKEGIIR